LKTRNFLFYSLVITAALLLFLFIFLPIVKIIGAGGFGFIIDGFKDKELLNSIYLTIYTSLFATFLGLLFGIPTGYILAKYDFRFKTIIEAIIDIPVVIPHTAAGIALLTILGRHFFLGKIFDSIGIKFINETAGIIVAMVYVSIPFLINQVKEGFKNLDSEIENVSRSLGANSFNTFIRVLIPSVKSNIIAGSIMMWARGISEFGAIIIIAYNPKIISTLIYERFETSGLRSSSPAVAFLLFIIILVFLLLRLISNKKRR
jgi:molybdate/tungstate transport system permease protein